MRTLLMTPLEEEQDLLLASLDEDAYQIESTTVGLLQVSILPALDLMVARGGHGKSQCGIQTRYVLDHVKQFDLVLCVGAAGSLIETLSVGDVVVSTETVEHDYRQRFSAHPLPSFKGDEAVVKQLRRCAARFRDYNIHFGVVASGDEDIVDGTRAKSLHENTGAIAVAWEGAGCARACRFSGVPFVEIRGITDASDRESPHSFKENLATAIGNAAKILSLFLAERQAGKPSGPIRNEVRSHHA